MKTNQLTKYCYLAAVATLLPVSVRAADLLEASAGLDMGATPESFIYNLPTVNLGTSSWLTPNVGWGHTVAPVGQFTGYTDSGAAVPYLSLVPLRASKIQVVDGNLNPLFTSSSLDGHLFDFTAANTNPSIVRIRKKGTTGNINGALVNGQETGRLVFQGWNGTDYFGAANIAGVATENYTSTSTATALRFRTLPVNVAGVSGPVDRLAIEANGNVGIGTIAPTSLLSVNGTADKVGGGTWGTFSDLRVKKNVQAYKMGLKEILAIEPVTFEYNGKGPYKADGKTYTGVIAQQIEKVLPSTVHQIQSGEFSDLREYDGSELTYTLINAVKEQQTKIEALEAKNARLEKLASKVEELSNLVAALEGKADAKVTVSLTK